MRIDLPLEMAVIDLPDDADMQLANMPDGTLAVGITASGEDEAMPEDADPQEFFAEVADGLA